MRRRYLTGLLAGVLALSTALVLDSSPVHAASGATIVSVAQGELANSSRNHEIPMGSNCNYYSGYWGSGSGGCGQAGFRQNAWCADFAHYVWATAGVSQQTGLDSWAFSFAKYGYAMGTLHLPGSGYTPQPGDAVVFDWDSPYIDLSGIGGMSDDTLKDIDHVGLVESYSSGTVYTIEGNASNQIERNSYSVSSVNIRGFITASGLTSAGNVTAQPVALYNAGTGNVEVYGNTSGAVSEKYWNASAGWSNWFSLGGSGASGQPAVVYNGSTKNVEVYANTGGAVSEKYWNANAGWSNWFSLGGAYISGTPAVVYNAGNGNTEVYATANGTVFEKYWSPSGWSDWMSLGGSGISGTPAVVYNAGTKNVELYANVGGAISEKYWNASAGWSNWFSLGGAYISGTPGVVFNAGNNNVEMYATANGAVFEDYWNASTGWSGWINLGGANISGSPSVVFDAGNNNVEVYANAGGHVMENFWNATTSWSGWMDLGGSLN